MHRAGEVVTQRQEAVLPVGRPFGRTLVDYLSTLSQPLVKVKKYCLVSLISFLFVK